MHFYACHLSQMPVGVWGLCIALQVFVCIVACLTKFIRSLDVTNFRLWVTHCTRCSVSSDFLGIQGHSFQICDFLIILLACAVYALNWYCLHSTPHGNLASLFILYYFLFPQCYYVSLGPSWSTLLGIEFWCLT